MEFTERNRDDETLYNVLGDRHYQTGRWLGGCAGRVAGEVGIQCCYLRRIQDLGTLTISTVIVLHFEVYRDQDTCSIHTCYGPSICTHNPSHILYCMVQGRHSHKSTQSHTVMSSSLASSVRGACENLHWSPFLQYPLVWMYLQGKVSW